MRKRRSAESQKRMTEIIHDAETGVAQVRRQAPLVDRLHAYMAARVNHNGFGRDFTLSLQPKGR